MICQYLLFFICIILFNSPLMETTDHLIIIPLSKTYQFNCKTAATSSRSRRAVVGTLVSLVSSDVFGLPGQGYCMDLLVGTPPQKLSVLLDTGSSNLAFAGKPFPEVSTYYAYQNSSTSKRLGNNFIEVTYVQGKWKGNAYEDLIALGSYPEGKFNTNFVSISDTEDFFLPGSGWQGIVGLAYSNLISQQRYGERTFFDDYSQKFGLKNVFSMLLCGTSLNSTTTVTDNSSFHVTGTFVAGGVNQSLHIGPMHYIPVKRTWYYEIVLADISVNGKSIVTDCKELNARKSIVDSGTTDIHLPQRVFQNLVQILKRSLPASLLTVVGEDFWNGRQVLCVDAETAFKLRGQPYKDFPDIHFAMKYNQTAAVEVALSPQQYLRHIGSIMSVVPMNCFKFGFANATEDTILGATFMEGFYTVFDRVQHQIGLSQSVCNAHVGGQLGVNLSHIVGVKFRPNVDDCVYHRFEPIDWHWLLNVFFILFTVFVCLMLLPVLLHCVWNHCCRNYFLSQQAEDRTKLTLSP